MKNWKQLIKASPLGYLLQKAYLQIGKLGFHQLVQQGIIYDLQTIAVMKRSLKSNSNCIDIGAHQGSILQEIIAIAPLGHHFAFEPLPHLAQKLKQAYPNVRVSQCALAHTPGISTFQYVVNKPAYSGLRKRIYDCPNPQIQEIEVEMVRLDDIIPAEMDIDFIKLDIEGGEFHAIQGAMQTILRNRPIIVFEAGFKSTHQYGVKPEELYNLIANKMGYHLSTMANWLLGKSPYNLDLFVENWYKEVCDYYFIAYPENT